MVKRHKNNHSRWLYAGIIILVIIIVAFLGRGWLRKTAAPAVATVIYHHSVQANLDKENNALGKPLTAMGLGPITKTSKCVMTTAQRFSEQIDCQASYAAYSDKVSSLSPNLGIRASQLGQLLQAKGWTGGNTTIQTLGENIHDGIDWTPDAAYMKTVGKDQCILDFNTAFSKPKPAALAGSITCARTVKLF